MSHSVESDARTLGSLSAADIGQVVTIKSGPATVEGVLAEVRHLTGDTSGRPITQVRLVWREGDEIKSGSNVSRTHGFRYERDRELHIPDRSDTPVCVRSETSVSLPAECTCEGYAVRTDYGTGVEYDVDRSSCPLHGVTPPEGGSEETP